MSHALLRCAGLTLRHGGAPAVQDLDLELPCGAFAAIIGPNGAGKSTLLHGLLGWHRPSAGSVSIGGQPPSAARRRLSYLAQRPGGSLGFPTTVRGVVEQGRYARLGPWRAFGDDDHAAVDAATQAMGVADLAERPFARLSGGQQQRALLARALASGADVLLLDEPLAGLDAAASADLLARLRAWSEAGALVVAVLHEIASARAWCTHALLIDRRAIAAGPAPEALAPDLVRRAYGDLRAVPA